MQHSRNYLLSNMQFLDERIDKILRRKNLSSEEIDKEKHPLLGGLVVKGILEFFKDNYLTNISNKDKVKVINSVNEEFAYSSKKLKSEKYHLLELETDVVTQRAVRLAESLYAPNIDSKEKIVSVSNNVSLVPLLVISKLDFEPEALAYSFFPNITSFEENSFINQLKIGYSLNNFDGFDPCKKVNPDEVNRFEYNFIVGQLRQVYRGLKDEKII